MQDVQLATEPHQSVAPLANCNSLDRFFALVIDSVLLAILLWLATHAFGTAQIGNDTSIPGSMIGAGGAVYGIDNGSGGSTMWTIKLAPLWQGSLVFLYFTLQEAFFGRTLGKAIMGLCVISQLDETTYTRLTFKAAFLRNLLRFIDALSMYLVGGIVMFCSPKRRRLGDMAAHTLVVNVEDAPLASTPKRQVVRGLQALAALLLIFLAACSLFTYFGSSQLVVQNTIITQPDFFDTRSSVSQTTHILRYTLGQASWGHDGEGQPTITYPISFTAINQVGSLSSNQPGNNPQNNQANNRMQTCQGSVILTWHWSAFDWELSEYSGSCRDL